MTGTSFYSDAELACLGFASIGSNVLLSKKASIYGAEKMSIGSNVRIDDFCILSGKIILGSFIHISAYTALYGSSYGIELADYTTISGRCMVYAESDDFSGKTMTNPMVGEGLRCPYGGLVRLEKYAIIGVGSVVLPRVILEEGAAVGAMSLVNKNLVAWTINAGTPCKFLKNRARDMLILNGRKTV